MSEKNLRNEQRVEVAGKNVRGKIAYIEMTTFASGKWVGVILDEPKGKNNGSIKGTQYFTCAENHGMFVRPTQLVLLDDAGNPMEESLEERQPRSRLSSSRLSLAGSRQSLLGSRSQLVSPATERAPSNVGVEKKLSASPPDSLSTSKRASFVETGFLETLKPQFTPGQSLTSPAPTLTAEDKLSAL